jgi:ribonuclease R
VKLLNYLADKIGLELDGIITGVESFGLFVTGVELPAEGFVHISALTDDYYRFDRAGQVMEGFRSGNSFRLGDPVRVSVAAVDVDARELDFRLIGRAGVAKRSGEKSRGKKRPSKPAGKPRGKPGKVTGKQRGNVVKKKKSRPGKRERNTRGSENR